MTVADVVEDDISKSLIALGDGVHQGRRRGAAWAWSCSEYVITDDRPAGWRDFLHAYNKGVSTHSRTVSCRCSGCFGSAKGRIFSRCWPSCCECLDACPRDAWQGLEVERGETSCHRAGWLAAGDAGSSGHPVRPVRSRPGHRQEARCIGQALRCRRAFGQRGPRRWKLGRRNAVSMAGSAWTSTGRDAVGAVMRGPPARRRSCRARAARRGCPRAWRAGAVRACASGRGPRGDPAVSEAVGDQRGEFGLASVIVGEPEQVDHAAARVPARQGCDSAAHASAYSERGNRPSRYTDPANACGLRRRAWMT